MKILMLLLLRHVIPDAIVQDIIITRCARSILSARKLLSVSSIQNDIHGMGYSKNKVHCSCGLYTCRNWEGRHILTKQEIMSADDMSDQLRGLKAV